MQNAHAAIVYNPVKVDLEQLRQAVTAEERRLGWGPTRWYETSEDDPGGRATRAALATEPAVVMSAGGDGTVRAVAEGLLEAGIPIALLPAGTGNLLARNLGSPLNDLGASVRSAFGGATRTIDVAVADLEDAQGRRTRQVFLVMAGIGLDADMSENTNPIAKRRVGWLAYVVPIARSIFAHRLFRVRYRIDAGTPRTARAHTIIVGNCGTLTGNMLLMPDAVIDDGLLDVVMLRPRGRFGWAAIAGRLTVQGVAHRSRLGRRMLDRTPGVRGLAYAQGERFDVEFESPRGVELDGDSFGAIKRARITVDPGALQVCVAAD